MGSFTSRHLGYGAGRQARVEQAGVQVWNRQVARQVLFLIVHSGCTEYVSMRVEVEVVEDCVKWG